MPAIMLLLTCIVAVPWSAGAGTPLDELKCTVDRITGVLDDKALRESLGRDALLAKLTEVSQDGTILSGLSVDELSHTVMAQDAGRLIKIPGIGKKTAERLLLELKDKFAPGEAGSALLGAVAKPVPASSDILNALQALGYNDKEASWAVKQLAAETSVTDGIRQALKFLSKA